MLPRGYIQLPLSTPLFPAFLPKINCLDDDIFFLPNSLKLLFGREVYDWNFATENVLVRVSVNSDF